MGTGRQPRKGEPDFRMGGVKNFWPEIQDYDAKIEIFGGKITDFQKKSLKITDFHEKMDIFH